MSIRHAWKPLLVAGVFPLLIGTGARAQQTAATDQNGGAPAGDVERGKRYYVGYGCYMCHGFEGQGGAIGAGPKLGPDPIPYRAFVQYVRTPRGVMPPYSEKLLPNEQDLADMHAYLRARPAPAPLSVLPPP